MSEPLSTTVTASSKFEYDFGVASEAMVTSPKSNGAPILSIVNVVWTSGVRLRSRGMFSRRTRLPNVTREWSWASARSSTDGAKVLDEGGRRVEAGSQRHGADAMGDQVSIFELGLSGERNADREVRLAGQAVQEHLVRREQRREQRGSGFRPGLLDRGVQLARRSASCSRPLR